VRRMWSIASVLSRNMAWRTLPLLVVLFMVGIMGTYSAAIYYDRDKQMKAFDTDSMQSMLLVMQTGNGDQTQIAERLLQDDRVEDIFQTSTTYTDEIEGTAGQGVFNWFSDGYLRSIDWPLQGKIRASARDIHAIGAWADHRLRATHAVGDVISAVLLDDAGSKFRISVQILGFLPPNGWHPTAPTFYDYAKPTIEGLSQTINGQADPLLLIGDYDALLHQVRQSDKSFSLKASVLALKVRKGLPEQQIQSLQSDMYRDLEGAAYTIKQIKENTEIDWQGSMKRNNNNFIVLLYVVICAVAAVQTSLIHRKREEMAVLRIVGAPWALIRNAWLLILLPLCALATLIGAFLTETLSGEIAAFYWLSQSIWLRLVSPILVIVITLLTNQLVFAALRRKLGGQE
jgi:hypothetical protein